MGREQAAAAAEQLGADVGSVTYRIRQMTELGLLRQARVQRRSERAIRYYRSVADQVFAPLVLTSLESVRELIRRGRTHSEQQLQASLERAWLQVGGYHNWGTPLYRPARGAGVNRDFLPLDLIEVADFWEATWCAVARQRR